MVTLLSSSWHFVHLWEIYLQNHLPMEFLHSFFVVICVLGEVNVFNMCVATGSVGSSDSNSGLIYLGDDCVSLWGDCCLCCRVLFWVFISGWVMLLLALRFLSASVFHMTHNCYTSLLEWRWWWKMEVADAWMHSLVMISESHLHFWCIAVALNAIVICCLLLLLFTLCVIL